MFARLSIQNLINLSTATLLIDECHGMNEDTV